jgi:uncharacterized membrane protein
LTPAALIRRRDSDLVAVILCGVGAALFVLVAPRVQFARVIFGLPFLLFAQGHAAVVAGFGARRVDGGLHLMLALALSITIAILVALALYVLTLPINATTVIVFELIVALATCAIAAARRERADPQAVSPRALARSPFVWSGLIVATAIAAGIAYLARPLPNSTIAGYTTLSAVRAQPGDVRIGVGSAEVKKTAYRVQVLSAGRTLSTQSTELAPGQKWTFDLRTRLPPKQTVTVRLFRATQPSAPYREVTLRA